MSDFRQQALKGPQNGKATQAAVYAFAQTSPCVADVIGGIVNEKGEMQMPPATLMIFAQAGEIKFSFTPKGTNQTAFGTLHDPSEGIVGVESALRDGTFSWVETKPRK